MGLCISKNPPSYKPIKNIEDIKNIEKYEITYFIDLVLIIDNKNKKIGYLRKESSKENPNTYTWKFFK